ncbi:MAG: sarcosine oxidase subunit alpha family protein [Hyphomicrobiaceae bacterium]|nr:sarcosine oxidase subunit alpha family protein [Hyphomicrobiaceae bacterium]
MPFRTQEGGRIARQRRLSFTFDGRPYTGCAGDTLASALIANGVHLVGRSYKYHRPRGILSAGAEEPNALVEIDRGPGRVTPNLRATQVVLYEGLAARSQNRWPSLRLDIGAVNSLAAPLLSAGFYYKTFMGPRALGAGRAWAKVYEPLIRRAAGLGRPPKDADPDFYAQTFAHCDVLVAGAGPTGLAAALAAGEAGLRVIVADEQAEMGGSLLADTTSRIADKPAAAWLAETLAHLKSLGNVRLLPRTQVFGYFAQNFLGLAEQCTDHLAPAAAKGPRERLWQVRARRVVIATGAIERPLVFPGNDRPGVMLADAARTYAVRYGALVGRRVVVATATDTAYDAATALKAAGAEIAAIVDVRTAPGAAAEAARAAGLAVHTSSTIVATQGRLRVSGVSLSRLDGGGTATVPCDVVAMSGGWTPSVHLHSQSRGKLLWRPDANAFVPGACAQAVQSAGACRGTFALGRALEEGFAAGADAAASIAARPRMVRSFAVIAPERSVAGILGAVQVRGARQPAFVDFQHDVTIKDLKLAAQEGFRSIEHVKRYTTTGMATDQGKTSNLNAMALVAETVGKTIPEVGLTTFRQPYTPVTFGSLAGHNRGDLFDPVRRTPMHAWAERHGAVFEDVGLWKRAHYFPRAGEDLHGAVARECATVRTAAGMFDASTLGKIEVVGPDAAELLERMYVNPWKKMEVGRCRYGVLLNEAGFIIDDGVVGRMAPDVFHVTTTTGGAQRVLVMMEDYLQTEFPELKVWLTSTTEQWAVIAVQGPKARQIIAPLVEGIDLDAGAFPHMSVREGLICGVETRLFRVSFTGELGFEINVPASAGLAVWQAVWAEAERHGACAYGTEAMHVLRAEKGFIIVGQETDGTVTPDDAGLAWAIGKAKRDFVGKRSLARPDIVAPGRKQLVGLKVVAGSGVLEEGAQITASATPARATPALGHVTSSYWSASLGQPIALALVADGRRRMGETLYVPMPQGAVAVEVVPPVRVDPKGEKLNG